jgi:hypothetical protein
MIVHSFRCSENIGTRLCRAHPTILQPHRRGSRLRVTAILTTRTPCPCSYRQVAGLGKPISQRLTRQGILDLGPRIDLAETIILKGSLAGFDKVQLLRNWRNPGLLAVSSTAEMHWFLPPFVWSMVRHDIADMASAI